LRTLYIFVEQKASGAICKALNVLAFESFLISHL
jgi:hypothetical protein